MSGEQEWNVDTGQAQEQPQQFNYVQPAPPFVPPGRKRNPWVAVAGVAIVLLLVTNGFWVLAGNGVDLLGNFEEIDYLELVQLDSTRADYYETLREEVSPQSPSNENGVLFCAELVKHDLGETYWPTLDSTYYAATGGHAYLEASNELDEILDMIGASGSKDPVENIGLILAFINERITYSPDMVNRYFAPVETLAYGSGDCDDYAILAAALFERVGVDSAIAFFANDEGEGHAMNLVHLDDLDDYGYYYYTDLTGKGLDSGRWIIIEPQAPIDDQYDPEWLEQWDLKVAAET